jgi:hypothetical protein
MGFGPPGAGAFFSAALKISSLRTGREVIRI